MTVEIGVIFTVLTLVIAYQGLQLNKQKNQSDKQKEVKEDTKNDAKESAKIQAQLEYIGKGVDEIRIDTKANEKRVSELSEKFIRIDESNKSAHKRIDKLEEKVNEN